MAAVNNAVFRRMSLGVEVDATPGLVAVANKRLMNTLIAAKPNVPVKQLRAPGNRFNTHALGGKEMTNATLQGENIGYEDLAYLFSSLISESAGSFVGAGVTFKPDPNVVQDLNTYTVDMGDLVRAERFSYGVVTALNFSFTSPGEGDVGTASLSGEMIGRAITEGVTVEAAPTAVATHVVQPKDVIVSIGANEAGLAPISRVLAVDIGISSLRRAGFYLNSDVSWTELRELPAQMSGRLVVEKDSVASGYLADLRASTERFIRVAATRTVGAIVYNLELIMPFIFLDDDTSEQEDLYTDSFSLGPQWNSTLASGFKAVLATSQTAL